jgi:hypothetical protein
VLLAPLCRAATGPADFYVAPTGSDQNPGTKEQPFATLVRARDAVRQKIKAGLDGDVTVLVRGGTYELAQPLVFGPADSGTAKHKITYAAYPGERPVLSGGRRVTGWQKLGPGAPGLSAAAKGKVWVADIPKGEWFSQLLLDGQPLPRSRTPNAEQWEDWHRTAGGNGPNELHAPAGAVKRYPNLRDVEINLLPGFRCTHHLSPVKDLDERTGVVRLVHGYYDIQANDPFRVENTLEGIDRPGEWCLDTGTGKVYLWPPEKAALAKAVIVASGLQQAIVLKGDEKAGRLVRSLSLSGLTIAHIDRRRAGQRAKNWLVENYEAGILLQGVEGITVENCRLLHIGGAGIRVNFHAKQVNLVANEIAYCGGHGIIVEGYGPGTHQVNSKNRVLGNHIHHCGRVNLLGNGIFVTRAGDLEIRGNHVHDLPYAGIENAPTFWSSTIQEARGKRDDPYWDGFYRWNEIGNDPLTVESVKRFIPGNVVVERNIVHDFMQILDDGGGIYFSGTHHNQIRNNLVYRGARDYSFGIYLDAEELDTLIENNVVYQCPNLPAPADGCAIFLHDGGFAHRSIVRNNTFALGTRVFRFAAASGMHRVTHNIFLFGPHCAPGDELGMGSGMDRNLFWSTAGKETAQGCLDLWRQKGWDRNSVVADPAFVDLKAFDLRLKPDSPALKLGFRPIQIPARKPEAIPGLVKGLKHADSKIRVQAAAGLGRLIGPEVRSAIPSLRWALSDKEAAVRHLAAVALADLGEADAAVGALGEALSSAAPDVRLRAAEALGRLGVGAKVAVPALLEALKDVDTLVSETAATVLMSIDPGLEAKSPALTEALEKKASVDGRYKTLLRRIKVPPDGLTSFSFRDVGTLSHALPLYAGHRNLPAGYWVYVYPYWYIWRDVAEGK